EDVDHPWVWCWSHHDFGVFRWCWFQVDEEKCTTSEAPTRSQP
ncbi:unnamed protein product, partial [marine sediment metagenome]